MFRLIWHLLRLKVLVIVISLFKSWPLFKGRIREWMGNWCRLFSKQCYQANIKKCLQSCTQHLMHLQDHSHIYVFKKLLTQQITNNVCTKCTSYKLSTFATPRRNLPHHCQQGFRILMDHLSMNKLTFSIMKTTIILYSLIQSCSLKENKRRNPIMIW